MKLNRFTESIVGTSKDIQNRYKTNIFDMIFLDADHRYSFVSDDIVEMQKMLKEDGIICGHDCLGYLDEFPNDIIKENLEKDCVIYNNRPLHCGVVQACHDTFQNNYLIYSNSRVWFFSTDKDAMAKLKQNTNNNKKLSCLSNDIKCPICDNDTEFIYTNRSKYHLYQCGSCDHIFVENPPSKEKIESFYNQNSEYIKQNYLPYSTGTHTHNIETLENDDFIQCRMGDLTEHIPHILTSSKITNIIEIGSLDSRVLAYLNYHQKQCIGVELNQVAAKEANTKYGVEMYTTQLEMCDFSNRTFDLIYNFHTLEHIDDVKSFLLNIYNLLANDGICLIHIPYDEIDYGNRDHLHIFSEKSISTLFRNFFEEIKITKAVIMTHCGVLSPILTISGKKIKK